MANVDIRTISQLPEVAYDDITKSGSYIEMSIPDSNSGYVSKKAQFSSIQSIVSNQLSSAMATDHGLYRNGQPIKSIDLFNDISSLNNGNMTINGKKTFTTTPVLPNPYPEKEIPEAQLKAAVVYDCANYANAYSTGIAPRNQIDNYSSIFTNPADNDYRPRYSNKSNFYFWHIDDQKTDSSESMDPSTGSIGGYQTIAQTGMLVICGWLADNGNISPENAWISLQAKIDNGNKIAPIAFQPWIQGKYSNSLQYVSFTIPVKTNLQLKIKTGFPVNGSIGGGYQHLGSMTFSDRWIPNAFYGYVIKT